MSLTYVRHRWYDPQFGRFLSEDPAHASLNPYLFAHDDPVNGSDPTGLDAGGLEEVCGQLGGQYAEFDSRSICIMGGGTGQLPTVTTTAQGTGSSAGTSGGYGSSLGGPGGSTGAPGGGSSSVQRRDHLIACGAAIGVAAVTGALDYAGISELRGAVAAGALAVQYGAQLGLESLSRDFARTLGEGISKTAFRRTEPALASGVAYFGSASIVRASGYYSGASVAAIVSNQVLDGAPSIWDFVPGVATGRAILHAVTVCRGH